MKKSLVKYPFLTREVEVYERDNGHTIVLAHKEGAMVNVSTWVKTGSINEDDKNNGISHFLEHLMFKGTHKHKAGEFDKILEAKGAIVNAATWKDYTFYYVTLPKGEGNKNLFETIELHADMMLDPVLPEEEIGSPFDLNDTTVTDKRERHVVIEEIRMRKDQNWTKVYNACNYNMYTKHPYKRDVIGTPEIISQVTRDDIMNYYQTFYSPANMTTIIVGDFDHDEILAKVEKEFDFKDRTNPEKRINEIDKPVTETKTVELTGHINTGYLMFGWLGPKAADLKGTICLDLISIIFGDGTSSRLYQNLIEKQPEPVFNMINSEHYQFKDGNNFFIQGNFKPESKELAVNLIKQELTNLLTNPITEAELLKSKKKTKSRLAYSAETVSEIGETIGYYTTVCDNLKLIEDYLNDLESITIEDLNTAIKTYLNINNAVISILMPEK
ncbi:insulinase family protein [Spirochaetes bacterium]|uniref:Insulinase family protein n=1 Tax=Candidatus Scatousia excrementipullorum TaxID=2840936 RepID=A0A9D9DNL5_9BACT|nr:insulinase family protein [Candidatus Scatousia excrementipullorum]